ncbi:M23 family metallopeptidase [Corynebacterium testudinoris]|uniref:Peptidase family M23 n=1 Tax=Corynebacterium testudinoris TaxID=136857 RepID=A0A0G3H8N3_9CORY|nr:M23 family metallopeptidase [Corynebacterium testudinoris]AKK08183.1 Peptidase family M23 [Corynebacterium testudinoris]MBX8996946.1 M23 family metallopeptidase [Corynebacterium testudinoris]
MFTRFGGKAFLAATAIATIGITSTLVAPSASAQEASFTVNQNGVSGFDADDASTALKAIIRLAEAANNGKVGAAVDPKADAGNAGSSDSNVIIDPLMLLLGSSGPDILPKDLSDLLGVTTTMRPVRGQTADGRTVVFPTSGTFTSGYGSRWGATHEGIDIGNSVGTPVLAVMDGTVIDAGPAQGFGNWIRIRHDDGSISVYGHMNTLDVNVGERVTAGQRIAGMGNEGQSTGPHLHFEIRPDGASPADPTAWFARNGITVR